MINKTLLKQVFDKYEIGKVTLVESANHNIFLIDDMPSSIPLDRWEYLEHILEDIVQKQITILPLNYAKKQIKISEGVVIKQWKMDIHY